MTHETFVSPSPTFYYVVLLSPSYLLFIRTRALPSQASFHTQCGRHGRESLTGGADGLVAEPL